jgi:hypothetical protein
MAGIGKLSALHALLLAFAFSLGFHAEPVSAQIVPPTPPGCLSDPRFVRVLGVWQGQPVCEFTGGGTGEDGGMPMRTAKCLADHGQVVVFNGYSYCVWYHGGDQALLAAIIYDPGTTPLPPDDIMFPAQLNSREETSNPNHCTRGPHFIRTLGRSRGVTLCQWSLPPVLDSDCPSSNNSNGRVRVFPTDFVNPPAPDTTRSPPNLPGTRYCVTTPASPSPWDNFGVRAVIMAQQPSRFDLGMDAHLVRRLPPGGGPSMLTIWIGSTQPIPAGSELVVQGSLTPAHYFAPMMPPTGGWLCTGNWSAFLCHKTLNAPLAGTQTLELPAVYAPGLSGLNVTYSASVTVTSNIDPMLANNMMTTNTTLY